MTLIEMQCNAGDCHAAFRCEVEQVSCPFCGDKDVSVIASIESKAPEPGSFNVGNRTYSKSLISDSLAINPCQIDEHRELFPDVEVLKTGQLKFDNFKQHDDYLKKTGFVKQTARKTKRHTRFGKGRVIAKANPVDGCRIVNS